MANAEARFDVYAFAFSFMPIFALHAMPLDAAADAFAAISLMPFRCCLLLPYTPLYDVFSMLPLPPLRRCHYYFRHYCF